MEIISRDVVEIRTGHSWGGIYVEQDGSRGVLIKKIGPEDWTPERVKAFWDHFQTREQHTAYFSEQLGRGVAAYLRRHGALRGHVLDYGCGTGALAAEFVRAGVECWGCDSSPASVRTTNDALSGRRGWHGAGVVDDPRAPHFGRRFDMVTCLETIEHVTEAEEGRLFDDFRQLTRPGGLIFLTTPNEEDLNAGRSNVYCPFCSSLYHVYQHVRSFDRKSLAALVRRNGFTVRMVETLNFRCYQLPRWPGIANVNLRYFAHMAMALPSGPGPALYRRKVRKMPHLCVLAAKEG